MASVFHRFLFLIVVLFIVGHPSCTARRHERQELEDDTVIHDIGEKEKIGPHLLFTKTFLNTIFAVDRDLIVEYKIFNVGDEEAGDIVVHDSDFAINQGMFTVVKESDLLERIPKKGRKGPSLTTTTTVAASGRFHVDPLPPGGNRTFILTLVPQSGPSFEEGPFRFHPAQINYKKTVNGELTVIKGFSTLSRSEALILSREEAERRFGSKRMDIFLFFVMVLVVVFIPYYKYKKQASKYDDLQLLVDRLKMNQKLTTKAEKKKLK